MTWPSADLHSRLQRDARLRLHGALVAVAPAALVTAGVVGWIRAVEPDTAPLAVVFGVIGIGTGMWGPVLRPWRLRQARENDQVVAPPVPVHVAVVRPAPRSWLDALVAVWDQDPTQHPPCGVYAADLSAQDLTGLGPVPATVVGGPHRLAVYRPVDDLPPVVSAGRTNILQRLHARGRARRLRQGQGQGFGWFRENGPSLRLARSLPREAGKRFAMMAGWPLLLPILVALG